MCHLQAVGKVPAVPHVCALVTEARVQVRPCRFPQAGPQLKEEEVFASPPAGGGLLF